jgi:hypothetical protein
MLCGHRGDGWHCLQLLFLQALQAAVDRHFRHRRRRDGNTQRSRVATAALHQEQRLTFSAVAGCIAGHDLIHAGNPFRLGVVQQTEAEGLGLISITAAQILQAAADLLLQGVINMPVLAWIVRWIQRSVEAVPQGLVGGDRGQYILSAVLPGCGADNA